MAKKDDEEAPRLADVAKYDDKPAPVRSMEDTAAAEARAGIPDQDPTYHERDATRTLDTSGPEHDPEVQQALRSEVLQARANEAAKIAKAEAKQAEKEEQKT